MNATAPFRKANLLLVLGGILIGIIGTAAVLSRRATVPPVAASHGDASLHAEETHPQEAASGKIRLSDEAKETAGIHIETARLLPMGESLTVIGTVELSPSHGAKITPPAAGKVVSLLVNLGDRVRAGQPLVVLDSFDVAQAQAAVRQAVSAVDQAHAMLQTAQAEEAQAKAGVLEQQAEVAQARAKESSDEMALGRQRELAAAGAFSQAPLLAAQSDLSEAQSDLLKAQTDLQAHMVVLQRTKQVFEAGVVSRSQWEQVQLEQTQDITQVARAKAHVDIAKQALEREQKVFKGDLLSKQAVQTAEAEVRAGQGDVQKAMQGLFRARQEVRKAQTEVQAARTAERGSTASFVAAQATLKALSGNSDLSSGGQLSLRAPLNGTVTEVHATIGEAVERSTGLFVIENLDTVLVNASIPEKEVARIRIGQVCEVTVPAYPGQMFPGVVQSVAGSVDEKTRTLSVRCLVHNPGARLRPEMFARVSLGVGVRKAALSVPIASLDQDGEEQFLYVEDGGAYERRKVEVGRKTATQAEILRGVRPGEHVVTAGVFVLKSESKKGQLKGDSD